MSLAISVRPEEVNLCGNRSLTGVVHCHGAAGASGRAQGSRWLERSMVLPGLHVQLQSFTRVAVRTLGAGSDDDERLTVAAHDISAAAVSSTATCSRAQRLTQCKCSHLAPVEAVV